jgi:ureidoacrylate peracid hydrolase
MHHYVVPEHIKERVLRRQGKLVSHDAIEAGRAALIVIDMQNYFVAEGAPIEVPVARAIVPNINRMAAALRRAGGVVVWIQTTSSGALERWGNRHTHMLKPEVVQSRLAGLAEGSDGFKLYRTLEPEPADVRVKKVQYSCFISGSSNIEEELTTRGIDTVMIAGTATNVCCESSARDAMMLDYRVIMLSDANAARTDEEHAATLNTFQVFFGDVMSVDDAVARLVPVPGRASA